MARVLIKPFVFVFWLAVFLEVVGLSNLLGQQLLEHAQLILVLDIICCLMFCACTVLGYVDGRETQFIIEVLFRFLGLSSFTLLAKVLDPAPQIFSIAAIAAGAVSWIDPRLIPDSVGRVAVALEEAGGRLPWKRARERARGWILENDKKGWIVLGLIALPLAAGFTIGTIAYPFLVVSEMSGGASVQAEDVLAFSGLVFFTTVLWKVEMEAGKNARFLIRESRKKHGSSEK